MFDIHIEDFFKDCSKALVMLYQNFPRKMALFVEDISGPDQPDEYGVHSARFMSSFGALLWLADEGYIQYETTIRQEAVDQATLTSKGLHMIAGVSYDDTLQGLIESIADKPEGLLSRPKIELIRYLQKHGTSSQLALAMQHLLKHNDQTPKR
ncbi:MAG: hypothetical protein C9356_01680 [Oleiphilus sp.]|nr:MAG: hypothetical protein C9356_01680 [Oleiphilus sp.]